jgi:hypothetical protein
MQSVDISPTAVERELGGRVEPDPLHQGPTPYPLEGQQVKLMRYGKY